MSMETPSQYEKGFEDGAAHMDARVRALEAALEAASNRPRIEGTLRLRTTNQKATSND